MTTQTCAVVNTTSNTVTNIVIMDPAVDKAPTGSTLVASATAKIGDTYNATTGAFTTPAPAQPTGQALKDAIDTFKTNRLANGFVDATTGKTFQADDGSIAKLGCVGSSALAAKLANDTTTMFDLIAKDNSTLSLNATDTFNLLNGRMMPWVSATMFYARTLKNDVDANNPPADYTQGWP